MTLRYGLPNNLASLDPGGLKSDAGLMLAKFKEEKLNMARQRTEFSERFTLYRELDTDKKPCSLVNVSDTDLYTHRWLFRVREYQLVRLYQAFSNWVYLDH
ncbi:hypothetical protein GE061_013479 [Apolygus lucorum]|uniref:Uncharacterized protein n=1 Tax=Apolygus lucorum TaxID=248454 RepID=A0A8S9XRZ9_APOLU|nr:hypothetical protein GE061_013479 [Apolygus lucorum]